MLKAKHIPTPLIAATERHVFSIVPIKRPSRFRAVFLIFAHCRLLGRIFWLWLARRWTPQAAATIVRHHLEALGGLWLKLGQILAMRTDLFSREFCAELAKLQEHANAFAPDIAKQLIQTELGVRLEDIFETFVDTPVGVASFAQVHQARLKRERIEVAVKVQKPYAERFFILDMAFIGYIFRFLGLFSALEPLRLDDMHRELTEILREELDYRYEGNSLRKLRRSLKAHKVYVPKFFRRYSSQRVLVMEFLKGVSMSEYFQESLRAPERLLAWLAENRISPRKVAQKLLLSQLRQIYEDNLFHGDLHPGNILLFRQNRIALIDLGTTGFVDYDFLDKYRFSTRAANHQEYLTAADLILLTTGSLPVCDLYQVRRDLVQTFRLWRTRTEIRELPFHEKSLSAAMDGVNKVLLKYDIPMNWAMLKYGRAYTSLDLTLGILYPDINYTRTVAKYFRQAEARQGWQDLETFSHLPRTLLDYSAVITPMIRADAMEFQGTTDKLHQVIGKALKSLTLVIWAGLAYAGWRLLTFDPQVAEATGTSLWQWVFRWPTWSPFVEKKLWIALFVMFVFLNRGGVRLAKELLKPEVRLPRSTT